MHRDVKTDNVILKPGVPPTAVWCDFGFARKLERTRSAQELNRMTICGTDEFMSPELMFDMEYSFSSDIFSFGVLIAEVVSGKLLRPYLLTSKRVGVQDDVITDKK